jgi:hypothetical protein
VRIAALLVCDDRTDEQEVRPVHEATRVLLTEVTA